MTPTRTDWRLIGLLYVGGLLAAWQFAKIALTLSDLSEAYPEQPVALLVSGVSLAGIALGATAGVIIGRVGPRPALLTALAVAAALSGLQALLPAYPAMMALRVVEGIAHLTIVVAAPTLMAASAVGRDVPVAMGLWGTFFGVGFALAALAFPLFGGVSGVLAANAIALLVLAAALWPILPRVDRSGGDGQSFFARHVAIYRNPRLVAPAFGFFAHTLVFLGLLTFLPQLLGGWTGPLFPLVALIGTFGAGFLARSVAPRTIKLVAFALSVPAVLLAALVPASATVWVVFPLMAVIGLVPGAAFADVPHLNALASDQALANGAIAQLGNVGTAASVPLFTLALGFGFSGLAVVFSVISTAGFLGVWLIHRKIADPT